MWGAEWGSRSCQCKCLAGHPCPFCGGTRSFAYMWEGDIADAVRLYPLGPALFAGTVLGIGGLAGGLVTRRTWSPRLTSRQWRPPTHLATNSLLVKLAAEA